MEHMQLTRLLWICSNTLTCLQIIVDGWEILINVPIQMIAGPRLNDGLFFVSSTFFYVFRVTDASVVLMEVAATFAVFQEIFVIINP